MNVSRKLFITMGSFIIVMSLVIVLVTHFVVRESLDAIIASTKGEEMESLTAQLGQYYEQNGRSWEGIGQSLLLQKFRADHPDVSLVLVTENGRQLYVNDETDYGIITNLGVERNLRIGGQTVAVLYYYDAEAANLRKLQIGISVSLTFLLSASAIVFVLISLFVAYWISRWLTAPLRRLIPAIDRLGQGEFGVQAPVISSDEYGKVAAAFNGMSSQLHRAEEIRRNMAADVAHELRTPLTIIRGKLDLLQQSGTSIEPQSMLPLQDELIRLTRLVDDLHQLSLAEAKKLPIERKPTDLHALLQRIIDHVIPDADDKQVDIRLDRHTANTIVSVDRNRMTQVFLNLLVNAIRYTPSGGAVNLAIHEDAAPDGGHGMLRVAVTDNGPGIDPEHLPYLFNRFYRTDEARARNSGGMGLGLAIAKEFVTAHNGTIVAESSPGHGTVFTVRLPYSDNEAGA